MPMISKLIRGRRIVRKRCSRGYTLIELMVAVGLFAVIMLLASGAYLMVISVNREAQSITTGIDNLSFALENMARTIRTGTNYSCGGGGDCPSGSSSFSFLYGVPASITYRRETQTGPGGALVGDITKNGTPITDPSVNITSLTFYVKGTSPVSLADYTQPYVTIVVTGTVSVGPGKPPKQFTVETSATMRGTDL
jgi:prepilin-type N-terminal cleavage/methylation domain-containing protein